MDWLCYLFKKLFCVLDCGALAEGCVLIEKAGLTSLLLFFLIIVILIALYFLLSIVVGLNIKL